MLSLFDVELLNPRIRMNSKFTGEIVVVSLTKSLVTVIYPLEAKGLSVSRTQFYSQFISPNTKEEMLEKLKAISVCLEQLINYTHWKNIIQEALDDGELTLGDALQAINWVLNTFNE
ncbi:hypothetical protein [Microseira sp. BLCC-F43]|uniref:hypothetical protein n=1 Tax=Microseira sp. BLCC-F43 TaxID=3153602 RepID=UPI0035B9A775